MSKEFPLSCVFVICIFFASCEEGLDPNNNDLDTRDSDNNGTGEDVIDSQTEGPGDGTDREPDSDTGTKNPEEACGPATVKELQACVEQKRYVTNLESVAILRPPGSDGHRDVQDLLAARLEQLGYEVSRLDYGSGVNIVGRLHGTTEEEVEVNLSAHYDHIPGCPGADDNASAVAGALEIARVLAGIKFERTLVVAFWDEEEKGLIGSRHYAKKARKNGATISIALVLEMIGYIDTAPNTQEVPGGFELLFPKKVNELKQNDHRADFIIFVADDSASSISDSLHNHAEGLGLPSMSLKLSKRQKSSLLLNSLRRSDHASFWDEDYPAIMISDTADFRYDAYHCAARMDEISLLNHEFSVKVIRATLATLVEELRLGV